MTAVQQTAPETQQERDRLDRSMGDVLRELSLCSHIRAVSYNSVGTTSRSSDDSPGGGRPPGDLGPAEFERWYGPPFHEPTRRHPGCQTNEERRQCILVAAEELRQIRNRAQSPIAAGETEQELKNRIVAEGEGWKVAEVARHMRCSERLVIRARREKQRDAELGHKLPDKQPKRRATTGKFEQDPEALARDERIRERRRTQSLTVRQIAMLEGVGEGTVKRALAANA